MESRIKLILMMLIMAVTVFSIWLRDVDSAADNGNPEGLRSGQWDNKNIFRKTRQVDWRNVCACRSTA